MQGEDYSQPTTSLVFILTYFDEKVNSLQFAFSKKLKPPLSRIAIKQGRFLSY